MARSRGAIDGGSATGQPTAATKRLGARRLFGGLRVMALLLGCVMLLIAVGAWRAQ